MKLKIVFAFIATLSLTACGFMDGYGQESGARGKKAPGFKNARGDDTWKCTGSPMRANQGPSYLSQYGLPLEIKGNFICDGDTPKLPKDCQGREIRSEAQFIAFWDKYQLPKGLKYFECVNGTPRIPAIQLKQWKIDEKMNPTCKDARGRKRPCV